MPKHLCRRLYFYENFCNSLLCMLLQSPNKITSLYELYKIKNNNNNNGHQIHYYDHSAYLTAVPGAVVCAASSSFDIEISFSFKTAGMEAIGSEVGLKMRVGTSFIVHLGFHNDFRS